MILYGGSKPYPVSATPTAFACANRSIPALRTKPKHNQQTKQKICFPSRQRTCQTHARATHYPAGVQTMRARICSAFSCDMFARVVVWGCGECETTDFRSVLCRTHSPRTARATNSCTREEFSKRGERSLIWLLVFFVSEKREKRKVALWFFRNIKSINHLNFHSKYGKYLT